MLTGWDRSIDWFSFNKPSTVVQGDNTLYLDYASDYHKTVQTLESPAGSEETVYISGLYERVTTNGLIEDKYYIIAGGAPVAVYTERSDGTSDTRYFHRDHLGSIDAITDESGAVVEQLSFDQYGLRRNEDWTDATAPISSLTNDGYTGHKQIDEFGLIDMAARMYDPRLGRFISADPFVPNPYYSQSYNRYSYVYNNPLAYTDPTGFQPNFPDDPEPYEDSYYSKETNQWYAYLPDKKSDGWSWQKTMAPVEVVSERSSPSERLQKMYTKTFSESLWGIIFYFRNNFSGIRGGAKKTPRIARLGSKK